MKSLFRCQISAVEPLMFRDGYIVSSHILLCTWLLIHPGIKVNPCQQNVSLAQTASNAENHYDDVIMTMLASQITSLPVVCSIVYSDVNQRKHQSSASLAFVREIHRGPVNFPDKWPVTRKMFPFDDVIMCFHLTTSSLLWYKERYHRVNLRGIVTWHWIVNVSSARQTDINVRTGIDSCKQNTTYEIRKVRHIFKSGTVRWLSVSVQCLKCVSNGGTAVLP